MNFFKTYFVALALIVVASGLYAFDFVSFETLELAGVIFGTSVAVYYAWKHEIA